MNSIVIAAIIVAVLVIAGIAMVMSRKRETERLQKQYGSEYEHQVEAHEGDRAKAEAKLHEHEKRVEKLEIKPLPPQERDHFISEWQKVQAGFVDDPNRSIAYADALLADVMRARGYPVEDFEQRAGDIAVSHPELVKNYRAAHELAARHGEGKGGTEDLRSAFLGYRAMFEELLEVAPQAEPAH